MTITGDQTLRLIAALGPDYTALKNELESAIASARFRDGETIWGPHRGGHALRFP